MAGIEPGSVSLHATELDKAGCERMAHFLIEHGELLRILKVHCRGFYTDGDLQGIDFAAHCPNLKTLDVKGVMFSESVFIHPVLKDLRIQDSKYLGDRRIIIGEGQQLRKLEVIDCHVDADTLAIAPESQIKIFNYYLDEDYAEACPNHFEILCTRLEEIVVSACWHYTVTTTRGAKRRNRTCQRFSSGQYGSVTHIYYDGAGSKTVQRYNS
jgi:hypothetical protein